MVEVSGPGGGGYDYVQDSTNEPTNPKEGEEWYQPDTNDVKTYDSGVWVDVKISNHDQLGNVSPGDHFSPGSALTFDTGTLMLLLSGSLEIDGNGDLAVAVDGPLTEGASGVGLSHGDGLNVNAGTLQAVTGNGLAFDQNGKIEIPDGGIDTAELLADAVTQAIIAANAVGSEQIADGAVDLAALGFDTATQGELDDHASRSDNPHNVTDDQTGAASALSNHESDVDAHHARPASTQSETITKTERGEGLPHHDTANMGNPMASETWEVPVMDYIARFHVDNYDAANNGTVYYLDGGTSSWSISGGGSKWVSTDPDRYVGAIGVSNQDAVIDGLEVVRVSGHNHSI